MAPVCSAAEVVRLLDLAPLPEEGGMYRRAWRSPHGSAIYFLLQPDDFSAMHQLAGTEIWHHYAGAPVEMLLLGQDGTVATPVLGDDLPAGERPLVVVEAGVWMGAATTGDWSLVGTTMAPPFDPHGFVLGRRDDLVRAYPEAAEQIARLTRE